MPPLRPNRVTITRPSGDSGDYEDVTGTVTVAEGLAVAITRPGGLDAVVDGRKEIVDATMILGTAPEVQHVDTVVDDDTADRYRVVWVRRRRGLGLDHQVAGLQSVVGVAQ